jgi:N-methylhydantoinase A
MSTSYIVGVDIGGTFTDCVVVDDQGNLTIGKASSTPRDFAVGVVDAVRSAAIALGMSSEEELLKATRLFYHASTVADNTLITRAGAKTGIIATKGFGDSFLMMRGGITLGLPEEEAAHEAALRKPIPFVPRSLIREVTERVDYEGDVIVALDEKEARQVATELVDEGVDSIAVSLLWSISNDSHEKAIADILRKDNPGVSVSLSSEAAPYSGEYERTATTVVNAYIGPIITKYLDNLRGSLQERGLEREPLIMQAYGGVLGIEEAGKRAVGSIESGPAAGVAACQFVGGLISEPNIVACDMGGTTFKVGVIREGEVERDYSPVFMRYRLLSSKIWVESIGSGGGSIAWIDKVSGLLKVGPEGAGASPGPVCYRRGGTEPTVTDADLLLGYLNDGYFLGGEMSLDKQGAEKAIAEQVAAPLGMATIEAANAIHRIVNAQMSDLIRNATIRRGHDPRGDVLFAFGGAGPVHASRFASELGIRKVIVPATASVHGAVGLVASDVAYEEGTSERIEVPAAPEHVNATFAPLIDKVNRELADAGFDAKDRQIVRLVAMRYRYQLHELNVTLPSGSDPITEEDLEELSDRFDNMYEESYGKGSAYRAAGVEITTLRVRGIGLLAKPSIKAVPNVGSDVRGAKKGQRPVFFEENGGFTPTDIYDYVKLGGGMEIPGPAIIETPVTTIVINPKDHASVDDFANIHIAIGS